MKILSLDTCTRAGSVALLEDGKVVGAQILDVQATHSERLLPAVDRLLADARWTMADLDLLACAKGPGSFTGLRIGVSTAKGMAFATGKPLVGVNSLEAMALGFSYCQTLLCPMIDARKRQVFTALFKPDGRGGFECERPDESVQAADFASSIKEPCLFFGDGADLFAEIIRKAKPDALFIPTALCYPRAVGIALLGEQIHRQGERGLVAHYVRVSDAELNPKFRQKES